MSKSKSKTLYVCQNCGAQRMRWEGRCTECSSWNSFVEEIQSPESSNPSISKKGWAIQQSDAVSKTMRLDQGLEEQALKRYDTGIEEFNRVLGGGLAMGSFVLLGGSPGIGKSTLLLQMAGGLAQNKCRVLYVSGEESVYQTASRAQRLGIKSAEIEIAAESDLNQILSLAKKSRPSVLVVDSIQTIFLSELESAPGSVSQVRECAAHLMSLAKSEGICVFLIGHVTKDGNIAGPKVLEHMVDTVLQFDGDLSYNFRLLRAIKNRFGASNELGVFQMNSKGMEEVKNPSELFLEERGTQLVGSTVYASMEGTRPLLCEVQALTLSTQMAMPRRTSIGIDLNRLHMISAVLDRHLDVQFFHSDIYINVVGGLKLIEPASDLAVAAALLSTESRQEIKAKACFFGEIGLTGEVRAVSFAEARVKEGLKLGFTDFYLPLSNKKHLEDLKMGLSVKLHYIKTLKDLSRLV
ncbi:MAG: DNA repair protein RadA [Pseudobdellovibrionaceae bacterium]